jgi:hypothetical protein
MLDVPAPYATLRVVTVRTAWRASIAFTLVLLGAACVTRMSTAPSTAEPDAETLDDGSACVIVQCNRYDGRCIDSANIPDGPGSIAPCPPAADHCFTASTTNDIDCVWARGGASMTCSCAHGASSGSSFDLPQTSAPDEALVETLWRQHCQGTCQTSQKDGAVPDASSPPRD